jgi:hypothetical protein
MRSVLMRRLVVVLALGAALGLGAGAPAVSAQMVDPYAGAYPMGGAPMAGYGAYGAGYGAPLGGYAGYGAPTLGYGTYGTAAGYGGYPLGPYGSGGYGGPPGYGGTPYGSWPGYASQVLTGAYTATGYPTFGYFPYSALNGNTTNPSPYGYYNPYAFFLGCSSTYSASNFYVCR